MVELLFGFPGETRESVRTSIRFMQQIDAPLVLASAGVRVFPGTELERIVRAEGDLAANPAVSGATRDNEHLVDPVYYVSSALGPDAVDFVRSCTAGDPRFLPVHRQALQDRGGLRLHRSRGRRS
jgi:tryptophan 2-C-methyltransferase